VRVDVSAERIGTPLQAPVAYTVQTTDIAALPLLLADQARAISAVVEDEWKEANIIAFDRTGRMMLAVPLTSLEQWVSVERRLNDIAAIASVSLISLTRDSAAVEITHFGDEAQLAVALAQQDLALEQPMLRAGTGDPFRAVQPGEASGMRVLRPITP